MFRRMRLELFAGQAVSRRNAQTGRKGKRIAVACSPAAAECANRTLGLFAKYVVTLQLTESYACESVRIFKKLGLKAVVPTDSLQRVRRSDERHP